MNQTNSKFVTVGRKSRFFLEVEKVQPGTLKASVMDGRESVKRGDDYAVLIAIVYVGINYGASEYTINRVESYTDKSINPTQIVLDNLTYERAARIDG